MKFLLLFARLLQMAGIVLCGYALYFGIVADSMSKEMMLLGIGGIVFYIGWSIQKSKFN